MLFSSKVLSLLFSRYIAATVIPPPDSFGIPGVNQTFDYIVVGGGNAGLAVAARLLESGQNSVAIIEAGGLYQTDNGNISVVPGLATVYAGSAPNDTQPLVDWGFVTTPQAGANNRSLHYARGKTLGGCTARNYMVYQRPTVGTFQLWAEQVGDPSYTFENVLPFFKKSCEFHVQNPTIQPNASNNQSQAGFDGRPEGPLQVSYPNHIDAFSTWMRLALQALGQKAIDGFNAGRLIGSAWVTWTINPRNAHRSSSMTSFFNSAPEGNLKVYLHSMVQRILFESGNVATGVQITTKGTFGTPSSKFSLRARKEVVIAAGAFQSPQLLMVSGVGPPDTLKAHGIDVVKAAPGVGQNMWDQPFWGVSYRVNMQTASTLINNPSFAYASDLQWRQNASGPLSTFGASYFGWEKLPNDLRKGLSNSTLARLAKFPDDWPEVEFLPVNAYLGYQRDYQTEDPRDGADYATLATGIMTPLSLGNVTIRSGSVADLPVINPNWLTDPADVEVAIALFKRQRQIWQKLSDLGVSIGEEALPGPKVQSDKDILNFIRQSVIQLYHASCTCKMGRSNDSMAVVDSEGRVYGTQALRVIDASIFPFLPPGHPQSTVYMLA